MVGLAESRRRHVQAQQINYLFLKRPDHEFSADQFVRAFHNAFRYFVDPDRIRDAFSDILEVSSFPLNA